MFSGLSAPPGAPQLHRWADWAELITLTSAETSLSLADFAEVTERSADSLRTDGTTDQDRQEQEDEPLAGLIDNAAAFRDQARARSSDVFEYLEDRSRRFSDSYPFEVDSDSREITLRALTDSRLTYLFILACASFRYIPTKGAQTNLASRFELMAKASLTGILPRGSVVELFGSNAAQSGRYQGHLKAKIELLADDIGETSLVRAEDFETGDSGDGGLDLVAWLDSGDELPGRFLYFAQVAATPTWISKQHSSSRSAWNRRLTTMAPPTNAVFIPFDYRRPGDSWYTEQHIHESVVMDRERILRSLYPTHAGPTDEWTAVVQTVNPHELETAVAMEFAEI